MDGWTSPTVTGIAPELLERLASLTADYEDLHPAPRAVESVLRVMLQDVLLVSLVEEHFSFRLGDPRALLAEQRMEDRLGDGELSVKDLAREVELSPERFREVFHQTFGESPRRHLTRLRMMKAQNLLQDSSWKVNRIAEAVGFAQEVMFYRQFKSFFRCTPTEMRRQRLCI